MNPEEAATMQAQQGGQAPMNQAQQNAQMIQEIGKIVTENNQMLQQIGQMMQQAMGAPATGEAPEAGGMTEEDMIREEAMARLAQQG